MDFRFTPEQEKFREEIRQFIATEVTDEMYEELSNEGEQGLGPHTWELMRILGKKRWLAPAFPEEYGGMSTTRWQQFILSDEMSYHRCFLQIAGVAIVGPTLLQYGSKEQIHKYLPPIARGEIEFALGYSEAEAGSDLANLQLKAEKKGDFYVLNGQKLFNSGCHYAQYLWLAVRTDPNAPKHKGISLLIADMNAPGITVRPLWVMDGGRTNEVFYDDVKVPVENLVGEENKGFYYILTALAHERNFPVGGLRRTFEEFVDYVKERGLGKDPVVRQKVAQLAAELQATELLSYRVTYLMDNNKAPNWEAPVIKLYWTEFMGRFSDTAMEIMGPFGQLQKGTKWAPLKGRIENLYRHAPRRCVTAGTSEIMRNNIATVGLGLPRG
ncbi:MAG: acyl-CoA dehydrogenase family protein [Pseudomonadota bacterium]